MDILDEGHCAVIGSVLRLLKRWAGDWDLHKTSQDLQSVECGDDLWYLSDETFNPLSALAICET